MRRTIMLGALGFLLVAPASAPGADQPQLDILSPAKVEVSADKADTADVTVRNTGPAPATVKFSVDAAKNAPAVTPRTVDVPAFGVERVALTFAPSASGQAATGELVATAPREVSGAVDFESSAAKGTPWWVYAIIFGSLALAMGLVLLRWLTGERKCGLGGRLGPADWDFSKSWGSNLTVVGALLGTIISASVLPDTTSAPKGTYAGLNLFFGALIVIAPFIYTATQRAGTFHKSKTVKEPQFQGFIWSFLLATAITLWAALGEIGTIYAVFNEIRVGDAVPAIALVIFAVLLTVSAVLLLAMSWQRIQTILTYQCDPAKQRRRHLAIHPELVGVGAAQTPPKNDEEAVEPELQPWNVL